jgi:hypothetical protein
MAGKKQKAKGKKVLPKREKKIIDLTAKLWKQFVKLPVQHNSDMPEIQKAIHTLQAAIMIRIARRKYPHIFNKN